MGEGKIAMEIIIPFKVIYFKMQSFKLPYSLVLLGWSGIKDLLN
jgi:hypothetical protein